MSKTGEIKYEIEWKWWTTPFFVVSELPVLRNWRWLQRFTEFVVLRYGFTLKGFGK